MWHYPNIITTIEQLDVIEGHVPRLARLIRTSKLFKSNIKRATLDEAHFVHTAGRSSHGRKAFRPSYTRFSSIRLNLPKSCSVLALSATLPPHILAFLSPSLSLRPDHKLIKISVNRPNICYAAHPIFGKPTDFNNLNFLVDKDFHPPMLLPKTIVFIDGKGETNAASDHIDGLLPMSLRKTGLVRHYHSDMTADYLSRTYEDFRTGRCRILIATQGASTVRNSINSELLPRLITYSGC